MSAFRIDCDYRIVRTENDREATAQSSIGTPTATGSIRLDTAGLTFTTALNSDERALLGRLIKAITDRVQGELRSS